MGGATSWPCDPGSGCPIPGPRICPQSRAGSILGVFPARRWPAQDVMGVWVVGLAGLEPPTSSLSGCRHQAQRLHVDSSGAVRMSPDCPSGLAGSGTEVAHPLVLLVRTADLPIVAEHPARHWHRC